MDGHLWQIALLAERTDGPRGARDLSAEHEALTVLVQAIMEAEVTERVGADYGERAPERLTQRNGYRPRPWDTRVGTLGLRIPKLREGSYFPSLLEPRRRSERALLSVVQQAYVEGISTRRVDDLGLMIITGAIAIAGTLLIFLADLDGAVDSMLVILVWVCMTVEVSPFFVALAKNRGNGSTRV